MGSKLIKTSKKMPTLASKGGLPMFSVQLILFQGSVIRMQVGNQLCLLGQLTNYGHCSVVLVGFVVSSS